MVTFKLCWLEGQAGADKGFLVTGNVPGHSFNLGPHLWV